MFIILTCENRRRVYGRSRSGIMGDCTHKSGYSYMNACHYNYQNKHYTVRLTLEDVISYHNNFTIILICTPTRTPKSTTLSSVSKIVLRQFVDVTQRLTIDKRYDFDLYQDYFRNGGQKGRGPV